MRSLDLVKQRNAQRDNWDAAAWQERVARSYDEFVKHRLYAGDLVEAKRLYAQAETLGGTPAILKRTRRKLRKARWLALIGKRIRHPKFASPDEIRG